MRSVLVIGGSYFAGRVFVEQLSEDNGTSLCVLNRGSRPLGVAGLREIACDRNDTARLKGMLSGQSWEAVVDFCGYTPQDVRSVLAALPPGSVGHYLFVSTVSGYAPTRKLPVKENAAKLAAAQPELGPAANYGYEKWLAEKALSGLCREASIPLTCLRPTIIYGKYNYAPRESYFFDSILAGRTLVVPEGDLPLFQFVSVWDVARIITMCLCNPEVHNQVFNLSAEELVSYGRFIEVVEAVSRRRATVRALNVAEIERNRIPLPFPLASHLIYDGTLIQKTLSFAYTPFVSGMEKAYAWYCQSRPAA